jgi:hypothetical protein
VEGCPHYCKKSRPNKVTTNSNPNKKLPSGNILVKIIFIHNIERLGAALHALNSEPRSNSANARSVYMCNLKVEKSDEHCFIFLGGHSNMLTEKISRWNVTLNRNGTLPEYSFIKNFISVDKSGNSLIHTATGNTPPRASLSVLEQQTTLIVMKRLGPAVNCCMLRTTKFMLLVFLLVEKGYTC